MSLLSRSSLSTSSFCLLLALPALVPAAAHAQESALLPTSAAAAAAYDGEEIIVTGTREGYRTIETTTGMKTETPVLDVPQSVSIVTREQMDDQAIRSMSDLVRLVPGVSAGQGEGHRDQVTLRGNNSTADFFVDGLRDDVQYYRSFYNVERVEVHKGANAMIFGRGGGGGVVNRILKGVEAEDNFGRIDASIDSFGAWYGAADVNLGLSQTAGARVNAFYERLDNHRDGYDGERWAVNPVVGANLGDTLRLQVGYEHVADDRGVDRGVPSAFAGTIAAPARPLSGYRDSFFGRSDVNQTHFNADVLRLRGEADLTDALTLSVQGVWGDYAKGYTNIFANSPVKAGGVIDVQAYRDLTDRQSAIGQVNLEWRGATGGIDHVLLLGAEATGQETASERVNGFFDTALNSASRTRQILLSRVPVLPLPQFVAGPTGNGNRAASSDVDQLSLYIQDQIGLTNWAEIVAGLRYDRFRMAARDDFSGVRTARTDHLWSPRVGLVLKPAPQASLYASFAKSYLPQSGDQFTSLDVTSAALAPEAFDNLEIGAKWDIAPSLTATAALFRLDRGNTRAPGPVAGTTVLTGEQRSKGFELSLQGKVHRMWHIAAAYGYTDAEIRATTSAAPAGRKVAQVPRHQISLWNRVNISNAFGFGVGLYHQSKSFASISNAVVLPSYTRVDAALFGRIGQAISVQLNIENLFNTAYYPSAHNDNNISTGAPRNARITVGFAF